jgi:hypothetical protein
MVMIEIRDPDKYDRAVGVLVRQGDVFHTRPTQKLIVTRRQLEALVTQGLVSPRKLRTNYRGRATESKS